MNGACDDAMANAEEGIANTKKTRETATTRISGHFIISCDFSMPCRLRFLSTGSNRQLGGSDRKRKPPLSERQAHVQKTGIMSDVVLMLCTTSAVVSAKELPLTMTGSYIVVPAHNSAGVIPLTVYDSITQSETNWEDQQVSSYTTRSGALRSMGRQPDGTLPGRVVPFPRSFFPRPARQKPG